MTDRLDSRALTLFVAVADALSFRRAAETLHLSQPPLSRAVRALEERLGARLFDRDTRSVVLTDAGRRLLPRARHILALLNDAADAVADRRVAAPGAPSALHLGLTSAIEPAGFAGLLERVRAARPALALRTTSDTSPRLVRRLRAQRLDAALIAWPTEAGGLDVTLLAQQPMVLALPSGHRLARRRVVALAQVGSEPVFLFERARQPAFFDHCRAVFAQHGFVPNVVAEPAEHTVLLGAVAAGRALALLPRSMTAFKRAGVSYRALKEGDALGPGVALVVGDASSPFRELLVDCAHGHL